MQLLTSGLIMVLLASEKGTAGPNETCGDAYKVKDYAKALTLCRTSAGKGDATGEANLGLMYAQGQGVEEDFSVAVKWFRKAAEQGEPRAQNGLGMMYRQGVGGVAQDEVQAAEWFRKAAEAG